MRKLYFLIVTFLLAIAVRAQTANQYTFSSATGATLDPMTGSTQLVGSGSDDGVSVVTNIGFTFSFGGQSYTQFSANANGIMTLGSTAITSAFTNNLTATANQPKIAPYWDDLATGSAAGGGKVHYVLTGTAPNRKLIVEWFVTVPRNTTGAANTRFQAVLNEGVNTVDFVYGAVPVTTNSYSVGIATSTTQFLSVSTAGPTTSTATSDNAQTNAIGVGTKYTFTPPPACVVPTAQGSALTLTPVSVSQINGSFVAASPAPSGYLVVAYPAGSTVTNPVNGTTYAAGSSLGVGTVVSSGATTTFSATGLNGSTTYNFYVYSFNNTACSLGPVFLTSGALTSSATTTACSMSGTKTIGATGDYLTLTAAIAALNANGASANVVFELLSTYVSATETFPIVINKFSCAGPNAMLTIRPAAGASVNISGSSASGPVLKILSSYVTIEGSNNASTSRNLTITNTSTTSPNVVVIGSTGSIAVTNVILRNTTLINGSNSSSAVVISDGTTVGSAGNFTNITIQNNNIQKSYMGIYAIANVATGNGNALSIIDNDLSSIGANAIRYTGVYVQGASGAVIQNNIIGNFDGSSSESDKGIWLASGTSNTTATKNKISNLNYTGTGGYGGSGIFVSTGLSSANILVSNNMIANITGDGWDYTTIPTDNPMGIALSGTQTGVSVYHNSINLYGNTLNKSSAMSMGIYLGDGSVGSLVNNIIVNNLGLLGTTGYGTSGVYAATAKTQFTAINYNDYFVAPTGSGGKYLVQIATTGQTAIAGVQTATGSDDASKNIQPAFTSNTDLHLDATANASLDNLGTALTAVTSDYDNQVRSTCAPDMGADEFGTVVLLPVISVQPTATQTVCQGANVTLSVTASNATNYQWYLGANIVPGATTNTLQLTNVTATNAGIYTVRITGNGTGACAVPVVSANAIVNVNMPPAITVQPIDQTACIGTNASFTVTATGAGLTYQWFKNGVAISGATSATYTINPVTATDADTYTVTVSGTCGTPVTSNQVTLATNAAPTITAQPQTQGVCVGNNVTLSVTASGGGLTYQWKKNGADITGATNSTYTINGYTTADAGSYTVSITSPCATNTVSNAAVISTNTNVAISTAPTAQIVCLGSPATFSVAVSGSLPTYQWRKGGVNITGATSATYTIAAVALADAANYDVVITGACNTITSTAVPLVVNSPVNIVTQPSNQAACSGGSATFSVSATGTGLTYQWFNGTTAISGATSASYTVNPVTAAGSYKVVVTGICGAPVTSGVATLTLNAPTAITTQPVGQTGCVGGPLTLSVTATGTALTYQWKKNGVDIAGATQSTYTINTASSADAGSYTVVVTGTCNTVTSAAAVVAVNAAIQINSFVGSGTVCSGATAVYTVSATSSVALTYQWRKNGVNIAGATSSTYTIASVSAGDVGAYDVVVSGAGACSATTQTIALSINANCATAIPGRDADIRSAVLMPNVASQKTVLRTVVLRSTKIDWTVTNAQGQVVMRFTQQVFAGQNNDHTVYVNGLAAGVYQLNGFTNKGRIAILQLIKP